MNNAVSKLFIKQIGQLDNKYSKLSDAEKNEFHSRQNISDLFLDDYCYDDWFISSLEDNENTAHATTRRR